MKNLNKMSKKTLKILYYSGTIWAREGYDNMYVPGGTETALGTGSLNTDKIIAQNDPDSENLDTFAAGIVRSYTGGGYTDWFVI